MKFNDGVCRDKDLVSYLKEIGTRLLMYNTKKQKNPHPNIHSPILLINKPGAGRGMYLEAFYNFLKDNAINPNDPNDKKEINYVEIDSSVKSKWLGEEKLTEKIESAGDPSKISVVCIDDFVQTFFSEYPCDMKSLQAFMNLFEYVRKENNGNCVVIATSKDYELDDALKSKFNLPTYSLNINNKSKIDSYPFSGRDIGHIIDMVVFDATKILTGDEDDILPNDLRKNFFLNYKDAEKWVYSVFKKEISIEDIDAVRRKYIGGKDA